MPASPNLAGQRFGRLLVMEKSTERRNNGVVWLCICDCGNKHKATSASLRMRQTKSCGCLKSEKAAAHIGALNRTHAASRSRAYRIWSAMRQRCLNPNSPAYSLYGGRGIEIDPAWSKFEAFISDMGEPPAGTSLDRRDNNGGYNKSNCRWATAREQANNRSANRLINFQGETKTIAQWAASLGIKTGTLFQRLLAQPIETAMQPHTRSWRRTISFAGQTKTAEEWAAATGISYRTICRRLAAGWPDAAVVTIPPRARSKR